MSYVKGNGIENVWLQKMILNPCATIIPFDYNIKYSTYKERKRWSNELAEAWLGYGNTIDANYNNLTPYMRLSRRDLSMLKNGYAYLAMRFHIAERWLRLMRKRVPVNYCMKGHLV